MRSLPSFIAAGFAALLFERLVFGSIHREDRGRVDRLDAKEREIRRQAQRNGARLSQIDTATAVHSQCLAGDIGRFRHQVVDRTGDVRGLAGPLEQGMGDDALPRQFVEGVVLGPEDGPRCNGIDADLRPQLACQRAGQPVQRVEHLRSADCGQVQHPIL